MEYFIKFVLLLLILQMIVYPACISSYNITELSYNITELHYMDLDLMEGLSNYINIMKENLVEYEDIASQAKHDILNQVEYGKDEYLGNPITVFSLVKRFSEGWGKLAKFIREDDPTTELLAIIMKRSSSFPTGGDLHSFSLPIDKTTSRQGG